MKLTVCENKNVDGSLIESSIFFVVENLNKNPSYGLLFIRHIIVMKMSFELYFWQTHSRNCPVQFHHEHDWHRSGSQSSR